MNPKKLLSAICTVLILCLLLCSCERPPADVGTLDFEGMESVEYKDADLGLKVQYLRVDSLERLLSSSLQAPRVIPYEAVWRRDKIYFLGKTGERQGLYSLVLTEDRGPLQKKNLQFAERMQLAPEGAQWSGLQCAGDMLLWEQKTESLPQERLALDLEEGMVRPPFQEGRVMYWNGSYYKFGGVYVGATLERMTSDGKYDTVDEDICWPHDESWIDAGLLAYRAGYESRIMRLDLEAETYRDALVIKGDYPEGVQCNETWLTGVMDAGEVFVYSYDTDEGHFVTRIETDGQDISRSDAKVLLRGSRLWILEEYQLSVYDLEQQAVQHLTIPESKYSEWNLAGDGRMVGCDLLKGIIITIM